MDLVQLLANIEMHPLGAFLLSHNHQLMALRLLRVQVSYSTQTEYEFTEDQLDLGRELYHVDS